MIDVQQRSAQLETTRIKREYFFSRVMSAAMNGFLILFAITAIFPLVWLAYNSVKPGPEFARDIFSLPSRVTFENYESIFSDPGVYQAFFNSLFAAIIATTVTVILSFVIAYFLARYRFRGRNLLYAFFLFGLLVPIHGLLVPVFVQFKEVGLLNNRFTLLAPYTAFGMSTSIFLIESYIRSIPTEMEEAAFIDGANTPTMLAFVIFPMCRPIIATAAVLGFLGNWNEFPFALILLSSEELKTIPLWLNTFKGQYTVNYTGLMAAMIIVSLPVISVYLIFREKIIEGFISGSVKA